MFIPFLIAGIGLGYLLDEKERKPDRPIQGPLEFRDYLDMPRWFNPISNTNTDQYIIGGTILVLLYKLVK
jgi:hypothetical protein